MLVVTSDAIILTFRCRVHRAGIAMVAPQVSNTFRNGSNMLCCNVQELVCVSSQVRPVI